MRIEYFKLLERFFNTMIFIIFLLIFTTFSYGDEVCEKAPMFILKNWDNQDESLKDILSFKKPIVISFFSIECKPCVKELPVLDAISQKRNDIEIRIICIDDNITKAKDFLKDRVKYLKVLFDPSGELAGQNYGVVYMGRATLPYLFIITPDGIIINKTFGYQEELEDYINKSFQNIPYKKISLIYTANINGNVYPGPKYGGMERMNKLIKKLREQKKSVILVDSGDFFPIRCNKELAEKVLKEIEMIKYDVVAIGDQELICGKDFFEEKAKDIKLDFISGIKNFDFKPLKIVERDGIKIGFIPIISKDCFQFFPQKIKESIHTENKEDVQNKIDKIRKEVNIIVLISHCGIEQDIKIAKEFKGIELIVGSHCQTILEKPKKEGDVYILHPGGNGETIGCAEIIFGEKRIIDIKNEIMYVGED